MSVYMLMNCLGLAAKLRLKAGQLQVVERSFSCSAQEFAEKMEPQLGKAVADPDGAQVWNDPSSPGHGERL